MTINTVVFTAKLLLLLAVCFSQVEESLSQETIEGSDATNTFPLENETTTLAAVTEDENVSENGTQNLGNFSITTENTTEDKFVTDLKTNDSNITDISSHCSNQSCENGGSCIVTEETLIKCMCPESYVGNKCETLDNCTAGDDGILCKNGVCTYGEKRKYRYCKCFLGHYWDNMKVECRRAVEPCFPNPCLSGGNCTVKSNKEYKCSCEKPFFGRNCEIRDSCTFSDGGIECENGYCETDLTKNRNLCKCNNGFYLHPLSMQCKKISPPCEPNPCENNGQCRVISGGKFNCTCLEGYTGQICGIENHCTPDSNGEICKNGMCKLDGLHSKRCFCSIGYFLDEHSAECKEISPPCVPNPCANGGTCGAISSTAYNCSCLEGFYGKQCTFVNKCVLEGTAFCKEANCVMDDDNNGYACRCPQGSHFDYNSRKCKVIDVCPLFLVKENAVCKDNNVTCLKNFKENNETGLCEPNFCKTKGCRVEGMVCNENLKDPENYKCFCRKGYAFDGMSCNPAFCALPGLSDCEQICEEKEGNFTCNCNEPFILKNDSKTCEYSSNVTCTNTTCSKGKCVVQEDGAEKCICPPGYLEQNQQCIDKCSAGAVPPGVCPDNKCETTANGFRCKCDGKYEFSPDNITCSVRHLCSKDEYGWKLCSRKNAVCVNVWNETQGFVCKCPPGTVKMENGFCKEICSIEENKRKCSLLGATCGLDSNSDFICRCPPSYKQESYGSPCNKLAKFSYTVTLPVPSKYYMKNQNTSPRMRRSLGDESFEYHKLWRDIAATMSELYEAFENANVLRCTQVEDFLLCTVEFQFQETNMESLKRIKDISSCVSNARRKDNICLLPPALLLRKDKIQSHVSFSRTDPCSELIKPSLCESLTECTSSLEEQRFSCRCKAGFTANKRTYPLSHGTSVIESCNDIDECVGNNPCPASTICSNTIGSYNCLCRPGYRTMNDSSNPKEEGCVRLCDHTPCVHGTCKPAGNHHFECICDPGFVGMLCNLQDQKYKDGKVNTIIVGAVLGGILLIVIIVFISKITRTRRKFGHESGQLILGSTEMTERRQIRGGIMNDAFERE